MHRTGRTAGALGLCAILSSCAALPAAPPKTEAALAAEVMEALVDANFMTYDELYRLVDKKALDDLASQTSPLVLNGYAVTFQRCVEGSSQCYALKQQRMIGGKISLTEGVEIRFLPPHFGFIDTMKVGAWDGGADATHFLPHMSDDAAAVTQRITYELLNTLRVEQARLRAKSPVQRKRYEVELQAMESVLREQQESFITTMIAYAMSRNEK